MLVSNRLLWFIILLLLAGCGRMITAATELLPGGNVEEGRQLFALSCAKCHDRDGEGDGPKHSSQRPPPTNLTLIKNTPDMNYSIVYRGVPGTSMPAHPYIPRKVFAKVAAFLTTIPADTNQEWAYPWELTDASQPDAEYGRKIYVTACAGCHGLAGDGNGSWVDERIRPKPANFHTRNAVPGRLYFIISHGRPGTMMAPQQEVFPPRTRWALAAYVHSLFDADSGAEIPVEKSAANESPARLAGSAEKGEEIYELYCAACHGAQAKGSFLAPRLVDREWLYGSGTDSDLLTVIEKGIPGKLMPSFAALAKDQKGNVVAYVRSRGGLQHPLAKSH